MGGAQPEAPVGDDAADDAEEGAAAPAPVEDSAAAPAATGAAGDGVLDDVAMERVEGEAPAADGDNEEEADLAAIPEEAVNGRPSISDVVGEFFGVFDRSTGGDGVQCSSVVEVRLPVATLLSIFATLL
jgi:hypothetical protein